MRITSSHRLFGLPGSLTLWVILPKNLHKRNNFVSHDSLLPIQNGFRFLGQRHIRLNLIKRIRYRDAPYRPTFGVLTKEVFKDPAICKTIVDHFPTPREMVRVEGLSDDQLTAKMSVLHCMMMSHGGELLARYRGLNQSHHEYVSGLNDKLATSDASFAKSKAKGKERKKKINSLSKILDNLHSEVARLSAALNQATILEAERDEEILRLKDAPLKFSSFFRGQFQVLDLSVGFPLVAQTYYAFLNKISEYAAEPLSVILQLKPEKLVRLTNVLIPRDTRVSPPIAKESTVTPVSKSLELSTNVDHVSFDVASEQNEEQGVSHVLDDVVEATAVESERISFVPTDVVVALSVGGKGDGSVPSSIVEEVVVPPFGV
ncbi:hypothetical protein Tco_0771176 [Tanacetum coccineum]|uniref:Uncharacterized protein n=1 Tax=Tanacetum coccineum TaxID=301880 RepID=A0ABQ4ZHM1_9ASTR